MLKVEKGVFDFGNEAAIPRLSPCCLPVFLIEKSLWALLKWSYNLGTSLLETSGLGLNVFYLT